VEIIKNIQEIRLKLKTGSQWETNYAGYEIITTDQTIQLLIEDESSCCEHWGYLLSEDDIDTFIGGALLDIKVVDEERITKSILNKLKQETSFQGDYDETATIFVNLETSKGTLQFVAYNEHNGYYGHNVRIISKQFSKTVIL
jgi:hypothetical protein